MGRPAPIPRRSSHLGSAACYGRSDHGSHSSTSAASSRSKRRQGNHNRFPTLKMFPDGHLANKTTAIAASEKAESFLEKAAETAAQASENLPRSPDVSGLGFALILSNLESVESAKQELERIKSKTGSLVVFMRQGRFRLAREFTNRDAAASQLSSLQTLVGLMLTL